MAIGGGRLMVNEAKPIHLVSESEGRDFKIHCETKWHWSWPMRIDGVPDKVFVSDDDGKKTELWFTRDLKLATCEGCRKASP